MIKFFRNSLIILKKSEILIRRVVVFHFYSRFSWKTIIIYRTSKYVHETWWLFIGKSKTNSIKNHIFNGKINFWLKQFVFSMKILFWKSKFFVAKAWTNHEFAMNAREFAMEDYNCSMKKHNCSLEGNYLKWATMILQWKSCFFHENIWFCMKSTNRNEITTTRRIKNSDCLKMIEFLRNS